MTDTTERDAEVIEFIRERLSSEFRIEQMVLFGSRARGTARADSDWDVLVITDSEVPFSERQVLAMQCLGRRDFAVDLLVYTATEAQRASKFLGSALYWAQQEGKVMYAKS